MNDLKLDTFEEGKYYSSNKYHPDTTLYVRRISHYHIDVGFFKKKKAGRLDVEFILLDKKTGYSMGRRTFLCETPHTLSECFKEGEYSEVRECDFCSTKCSNPQCDRVVKK